MKIVAELDTKEKSLKVTMDGKAVDNVTAAMFFKDFFEEDKFHVDVTTVETDDEEEMSVVTRVSASEKVEVSRTPQNKPSTELIAKALFKTRN